MLVRVHLLALLDAIDARQAKDHSPLRRSRSNSPSGSFSSSPAAVRALVARGSGGRERARRLTVSCAGGTVDAASKEGEGLLGAPPGAARHPLRVRTLRLHHQPPLDPQAPPSHTQRREALPLPRVRQGLPPVRTPRRPPPRAHDRSPLRDEVIAADSGCHRPLSPPPSPPPSGVASRPHATSATCSAESRRLISAAYATRPAQRTPPRSPRHPLCTIFM